MPWRWEHFKFIIPTLLLVISSCLLNAQDCLPEGIIFETQEEVDSFIIKYPDCERILGYLGINSWMSPKIENLDGLVNIKHIEGHLFVTRSYPLIDFTGFENLLRIGGSLILEETSFKNFKGLENITSIGGDLYLTQNFAINNFEGLQHLSTIGGKLRLYGNFFSLEGLNSLYSVGGNVEIYSSNLENVEALGNLHTIGGGLSIVRSSLLSSLDGLENLQSINGYLSIYNLDSLNDIGALEQLAPEGIQLIRIYNCPQLAICDLSSICGVLNNYPERLARIENNAPGCLDSTEVHQACPLVATNEAEVLALQFSPNPVWGTLNISGMDADKLRLKVMDSRGKVLHSSTNRTQIDFSSWPNGLYFVQVKKGKKILTKRILHHSK